MQAKNLIRQSIKDEKIIAEQHKRYNSMRTQEDEILD